MSGANNLHNVIKALVSSKTVLSLIILYLGFQILYSWLEYRDPQGGENAYCEQQRIPTSFGPGKHVIAGHETFCTTFASDAVIYLYLHKAGQKDESWNLIFRYDGTRPAVHWIDQWHIRLTLDYVSSVTKQVVNLDGIEIEYQIAKQREH